MDDTFRPNSITELPFGYHGKIYRSPMPFSSSDEDGELIRVYQQAGIEVVVILAPRQEYLSITGQDLRKLYQEAGLMPIEMPVPDFGVPEMSLLDRTISEVIECAQSGQDVVVHCHAGFGRTGTFLACMAIQVFNVSGLQAISWVRRFLPPALENADQMQFVLNYGNRYVDHKC